MTFAQVVETTALPSGRALDLFSPGYVIIQKIRDAHIWSERQRYPSPLYITDVLRYVCVSYQAASENLLSTA